MAIYGSLATVRTQLPQTAAFATALAYLEEVFRPGSPAHTRIAGFAKGDKHIAELANGVRAMEAAYETKTRAEGFFESHRKYIDIQVVVVGEEIMEVIDLERIIAREPYDAERDLLLYGDKPEASVLRVHAGYAAVFFPADVHMPTLRLGESATLVKKTVLKVPV